MAKSYDPGNAAGILLEAGAGGGGIEGLLRAVYEITGLPVAVLDTLYRLIGFYGPGIDPEDCRRKEDDDPKARRAWRETGESSPEPVIDDQSGGKYRGMCMDVMVNGETLAKITFFVTRPFREEDRQVMLVFSQVLSCLMQGSAEISADIANRGKQLADLLKEMVRGEISLQELKRINSYYHLPVGNEICVIVLEEREGIDAKYEAVLRQLQDSAGSILCAIIDDRAVGLFPAGMLKDGLEQMEKILSFFNLRMGVSRPFVERSQTRDHYLQALSALDFARKQNVQAMKYEDCLLEDIAGHCPGERHAASFCRPEVLKLMEYDRENQTRYAETFYIYCKNLCSLTDTSKETFLHYNTIKYRVQKFREIAGIDRITGRDLCEYLFSYALIGL